MKLILAPLLANYAFAIPFAPPPAVPEIVNVVQTEAPQPPAPQTPAALDCSAVWDRTCTGTNSNGQDIYGSWTCGERVQYVHDYKLGRTPTMSAAIDQILSECPTQCQELENNQCDTYVEANLETVAESDCSATWEAMCTGVNSADQPIYGSYTCGDRVAYVHNVRPRYQNSLYSVYSVYYQCREQCAHIAKGQCRDFVDTKLSEIAVQQPQQQQSQQQQVNDDDYDIVVDDTVTTRAPLATCQEAYDRVCNEGYGSYTCGARVNYVYNHPGYNTPALTDATAEINRQCPNDCREFQNNNCDALIAQNYADSQNSDSDYS
jgi:hypothetical protein